MKVNSRLYTFLLFIFILPVTAIAQGQKDVSSMIFEIDTLKDLRLKIDGGCGIYEFDSWADFPFKTVFVISAHKVAFFAIKGLHDYIYAKLENAEILPNGSYEEQFSGQGFHVILITSGNDNGGQSKREGLLKIYNKTKMVTIQVKGKIDYRL